MGFAMLKSYFPQAGKKVYVPNPTWSLHHNIIARAGFELNYFRYYNPKTKGIDMPGMLEDLIKWKMSKFFSCRSHALTPQVLIQPRKNGIKSLKSAKGRSILYSWMLHTKVMVGPSKRMLGQLDYLLKNT